MRSSLLACSVLLHATAALAQASRPADGPAISEEEFKRLHELRRDGVPELRGQMIELAGDQVYLSLPARRESAPLPGVVVIQEWWGLNENVKHWADRVAAEGYAALAVDLYGGRVATDPDQAMALMQEAQATDASRARSLERLRAAVRFLTRDERVRAPRVASLGWCFGGGWSLRLALAEPELDAAVLYYGELVTDVAALRGLRCPLLGVFATRDTWIRPAAVDAFERALGEAGVRHEVLRYEADHAFANPSNPRYAQTPAGEAWERVRAFLRRALQP